jgi:predicted RecB family nuclease
MKVTASILYDLVHCPQRVALDAFGDPLNRDEENAFVRLLWERGHLYETETIAKLKLPFTDLSGVKQDEREVATIEAMKRGDVLIYSGCIVAGDLLGVPDLLRKEVGGYVPGDIKSGAGEEGGSDDGEGRPKVHYAVQLALYVDILEKLGLSAGRRAFVWDIKGKEVAYDFTRPQGPKTPETLWDEYQFALADARAILAKIAQGLPAYSAACKNCHWYTYCVDDLTVRDDLTLIPGLGRSLRDKMLNSVASIADLASSNPDAYINGKKTIFSGISPDRLRLFHERAILLKSKEPKPYLRSTIVLPVVKTELFFDVEVDPLRDHCYLHGIVERSNGDNDTEKFVSFFAEDVTAESERAAFAAAMAYFKGSPEGAIYHYSKYERTIYRKLQERYPDVCTSEEVEALFSAPRATDLYGDVVLKATEWPTRDQSVKTLAKFLGFNWRDAHPSGAASIEWFDRWCKERRTDVKQRILDYNEDDCRATRVLLDGIRALA